MPLDQNRIKGIIWDLDNTLYRFTDEFKTHCNQAAAEAALEVGIDLSHADAFKIAERSEELYGYSMHIYVTDHGLSYADLHIPFHRRIDENIIEPIEGALGALEKFKGHQVILTNASRCWAERALNYIGANHLFKEEEIIPIEDVDFVPKARDRDGFNRALEILNIPANDVLMVDDLDRNLVIPHQMGMQTVYMHHGKPIEHLPETITDQAENLVTLMDSFTNPVSQT